MTKQFPFNTPLAQGQNLFGKGSAPGRQSKILSAALRLNQLSELQSSLSTDFERTAALKVFMMDRNPNLPADTDARRFVFRSFHMHRLASFLASAYQKKRGAQPLFLAPLAIYSVACERTHLDWVMMLSVNPKNSYRDFHWEYMHYAKNFHHLPVASEDWFLNPPEPLNAAMRRFDTWHKYTALSFNWWLYSKFQIVTDLFNSLREETQGLGMFHLRDPKWIKDFMAPSIVQVEREFQTFLKNKGSAERLTNLKLATWLIEIWPLVLDHGWQFGQIARLAPRRFIPTDQLITSDRVKDLCDSLALHLPKKARGRPRKNPRSTLSPPEWLATRTECIGSPGHSWLYRARIQAVPSS